MCVFFSSIDLAGNFDYKHSLDFGILPLRKIKFKNLPVILRKQGSILSLVQDYVCRQMLFHQKELQEYRANDTALERSQEREPPRSCQFLVSHSLSTFFFFNLKGCHGDIRLHLLLQGFSL